jgi:hypothetical protein
VTVWETFNVGFLAPSDADLDASNAEAVRRAAEETAAEGAKLAEAARFRAQGIAVEMSPTWQGLVNAADDRGARSSRSGGTAAAESCGSCSEASRRPSPRTGTARS